MMMAMEARIKKQIEINNHKCVCCMFMNNNKHSAHTYKRKCMNHFFLTYISFPFATTVNFNVQLLGATESKVLASASEMQQNSGHCKNSLDENGWYIKTIKNIKIYIQIIELTSNNGCYEIIDMRNNDVSGDDVS